MGLATGDQLIERRRQAKLNYYVNGRHVTSLDDPEFEPLRSNFKKIWDMSFEKEWQDMGMVVESPLINEPTCIFNHMPTTAEEMLQRQRLIREVARRHQCTWRCPIADVITTLWIQTYELDKKYGTDYHSRAKEWIANHVQKEDVSGSLVITDAKGDRKVRPSKQPNPDMYLRIVEKRKEGVVIRGGKVSTSLAPVADWLMIVPGRNLQPGEEEYCIACVLRNDEPGITYVSRNILTGTGVPDLNGKGSNRQLEYPLSSTYATCHHIAYFDNVLVPWEHVFMCGETEFALPLTMGFADVHRTAKSTCAAGRLDLLIGALSLVMEANGLSNDRRLTGILIDMQTIAEAAYACSLAACTEGSLHESGVFELNPLYANAGKVYAASNWTKTYGWAHDICGAGLVTMPQEITWNEPKARQIMETFYKGAEHVSAEDRIRAYKLVEDLTSSNYSGWLISSVINAAGSPEAERRSIFNNYDMGKARLAAKQIAGIQGMK